MKISMTEALSVLVTGLVVVFAVLVLLVAIIKIYSTIVYKAQNKPKKDKSKDDDDTPKGTGAGGNSASAGAQGGISSEVLACIAAAVEAMYGAGSVRIKNIKKVSKRSAWGNAGVVANTRPF